MVYYHTSGNVKMLRNIILDYGATSEVSPFEYMRTYIEKCPDTEDAKISWIAETFLGIQKHKQFLKTIASHMSEELSVEEQDYFMIIFHALMHHIGPKDMQYLYKCLFNLSKPLLNTFTNFLSNNEVFDYISQVAQLSYDTRYITDKIIGPLFTWQPYISEMAHNYAEYLKKIESRKVKPSTVPIQPNVLNRKGKETTSTAPQVTLPATPPNSLRVKSTKKMLMRSTIDQKLKQNYEKNKHKASVMLNDVRTKEYHFAREKSERYYKTLDNIRDEMENELIKPQPNQRQTYVIKHPQRPIKENIATIKRINKRIQSAEEEEVLWLQNLMSCFKNTTKVEELEEYDRQERERERLYDIERKHLVGQISHEEALLAKKKVQEENKKKYEEFIKEKEVWNEEIERWKKVQIDKNRKQVEKLSMIELNLLQAKNSVAVKKKENVEKIRKESESILKQAMKVKQEELERKINMIKEIKILSLIAKKAKLPKIIDLTESSGLGLLCEMSIAELQERLSIMKIGLKEELERKKQMIKNEKLATNQELENTKTSIKNYMIERSALRKQNKKQSKAVEGSSSKEINNLRKILEEKRRLRLKLTN